MRPSVSSLMRFGSIGNAATLLLTVALRLGAQAQPAHIATPHWVLDQWGTDQGLPQNTVNAIVQTPDGFLWLGTYGGLVRFDGVRFTAFTTEDYPGLGSDRVMRMALGRNGIIWIGTDRGLVRFEHGTFTEYTAGRPAGYTNWVSVAPDGAVWVTSQLGGLARFAHGTFQHFPEFNLSASYGGTVAPDSDGNVWMNQGGTKNYLLRNGATRFVPIRIAANGLVAREVRMVDRRRRVWFETDDGPAMWNGHSLVPLLNGASRVIEDGAGGYWALLHGAAWHVDSAGARTEVPPLDDGSLSDVATMFVDREGTLWLGTLTHGLLRLRPRLFRMYMKSDGLADEQVTGILRDRRGTLWVGSSCGPTSLLEADGFHTLPRPGCVSSLAQTPDGAVWAGSYGGGVTRIAPSGRQTRIVETSGLSSMLVLGMWADPDTSVWFGTDRGLDHDVNGTMHVYTTTDGLPSNEINFVTRDRQRALWVGTVGGLARLDGRRFTSWTTKDGLPHNYVRAVYEDADGIHWIGTYGGGLARFDGHHFTVYNRKNGLYDDIVSSIVEDRQGNLWMSGNRGVFRASRAMLDAYAAGKAQQVLSVGYGPSDGLLTAETNGGLEPAVWQDKDGRLWYPTVRGLATVDPREAVPDMHVPGVVVEALRADGVTHLASGVVRVPVGTRSLEIDYTGLTSVAPEQLVFRYRLGGLSEDWQYVNDRRTAYYSGLGPGRYVFQVSAANRDGVWSPASTPLTLIVPPAWYQTLWFRVLAILAVVGTAATVVRARIARLHEQQRRQREFSRQLIATQEQERGRLAGELHDSLGQDLLVMKNRAAMALRSAPLDPATRGHLEEISQVAAAAVQNAREISHGLRPYQLDRLGLAAALQDLGHRVAASGGPAVEVEASDAERAVGPTHAIHIFRIAQEALNNVIKHAEARRVSITLRRDGTAVRLIVADDGRGMDAAASHGFGLTGIAQRVQLLGGTLVVRSAPGHGTTLDIALPEKAT